MKKYIFSKRNELLCQDKLKNLVVKIKDGTHSSFKDSLESESHILYSAKNIKEGKLQHVKNDRKISGTDYDKIVKNGFPGKKDVLLTIVGTIGETMIWEKEKPEAFQRSVAFIRCGSLLIPEYLCFALKSSYMKKDIVSRTKIGAQPGIYLKDIGDLDIKLTNLKEQKRIADVLSKQESIISKTKELISELEKRNTFMLDELLSGRLRIKEENGAITFYKNPEDNWQSVIINGEEKQIPKDWCLLKLNGKITCSMGETILSANIDKSFFDESIPVISASQDEKYFGYISKDKVKKILNPGDLTICARGSIGFPRVVKEVSASTQTTIQVRSDQINLNYLCDYLNANHEVFFSSTGGAVPQLTLSKVNNFEISYSGNEYEIQDILNFVKKIKTEKGKYEQLLLEEQKKFDFLLEELMSGRLRIEE